MICPEIIYMVTGFTRCGTSMMMNCLIAGGMDAEYDESYEGLKYKTVDGYHGNPQGYRELEGSKVESPDFPECYSGKLIKMPNYWWTGTRGYGARKITKPYKVIFMRRDWDEQRFSRRRLDDHTGARPDGHIITTREPIYRKIMPEIRDNALTYDEVWYPVVVENPLPVFEMLADHGWPIDPQKSAQVPDPSLYRIKKENL